MNALTAAHKTLPMPSQVRVTNLGNGRSIVLRINDRGPFANSRIIDVSRRGAQLLGFAKQGTAKVRVTLITEDEGPAVQPKPATTVAERTALPALPRGVVRAEALPPPQGVRAAPAPVKQAVTAEPARLASTSPRPDATLATGAAATEVDILSVSPSRIFIQAGAFLRYDNATRLRARLASLGRAKITTAQINEQEFFRVRLGPLVSVPEADRVLARIIANGIKGARIIVD
jgi:rare lipoprotein A